MTVTVWAFGIDQDAAALVRGDQAYQPLLARFVEVARGLMVERRVSELGQVIVEVCDQVFGSDRASEKVCVPLLLEDCARLGALRSAARGLPEPPAIGPVSGVRCRAGSRQVQAADDRGITWRGPNR